MLAFTKLATYLASVVEVQFWQFLEGI